MKTTIAFLIFLFTNAGVFAQNYTPSDSGSSVKFTIKNLGINTSGSFYGLKGMIKYSSTNPSAASFNVTVASASINTGIGARDNHLKKEEYFFVEKFPVLHFESYKVSVSAKGGLLMDGIITIKGVSKEVFFPFTVEPKGKDLLFKGTFSLNRRDFNVGGSSLVLSDNLTVNLSVLAQKTP